ncbi:hypothetical protein D0962_33990 [Leptolyngbyaceae cyanobacterium CCMR0082]|uniref:Polymerase nucleotidyl transferase domain-containing protein n=1 Tax=Adonisia turfae CCMR0082 TaxID=2304604 RepID=A0A6M0SHB7_9CYAN|nr:nucleotidyltransferase family protein [Adonisia turfae]NEZ67716.1 hypothetical protein [Adonisia turfae CCMR0082]
MSTLEYLRQEKRDEILALAEKHGISNVRIFGSVAREKDTPDSDVDFLINLQEGHGLFDWIHFKQDLEELLNLDIDVWPESNLKPYILPGILADAQPL